MALKAAAEDFDFFFFDPLSKVACWSLLALLAEARATNGFSVGPRSMFRARAALLTGEIDDSGEFSLSCFEKRETAELAPVVGLPGFAGDFRGLVVPGPAVL